MKFHLTFPRKQISKCCTTKIAIIKVNNFENDHFQTKKVLSIGLLITDYVCRIFIPLDHPLLNLGTVKLSIFRAPIFYNGIHIHKNGAPFNLCPSISTVLAKMTVQFG